jgi:hypothetical protein
MCQSCPAPAWSRRSFLRQMACTAVVAGLGAGARSLGAPVQMPTATAASGWARMITPNSYWHFHDDREAMLLNKLRGIPALGYGGEYRTTKLNSIDELCRTPFLFSLDLAEISEEKHWDNLREYLYRGGFLFVENCVKVSNDLARWRMDQLERLTRLLPASEWRKLSLEHPVFKTPFKCVMPRIREDGGRKPEEQRAFYGVFDDSRMVAVVSQAQLFCGWPQNPEIVENCQQLMANLYHYSRTH